jgi:RNA polymerase sigma factor (sigma-70 family)
MWPHHSRAFIETQQRDRLAAAEQFRSRADAAELDRVVRDARAGNGRAWGALIDRFTPRIRRVARAHRLPANDVEDVVQTTWLRLLEHVHRVADPKAVGSWLETTARHESLRVIRAQRRELPVDGESLPDEGVPPVDDERLVAAERSAALIGTLATLRPRERDLLAMLLADPAPSYAEISQSLGIPIGSIGPTRARMLERLRRDGELVGVIEG